MDFAQKPVKLISVTVPCVVPRTDMTNHTSVVRKGSGNLVKDLMDGDEKFFLLQFKFENQYDSEKFIRKVLKLKIPNLNIYLTG